MPTSVNLTDPRSRDHVIADVLVRYAAICMDGRDGGQAFATATHDDPSPTAKQLRDAVIKSNPPIQIADAQTALQDLANRWQSDLLASFAAQLDHGLSISSGSRDYLVAQATTVACAELAAKRHPGPAPAQSPLQGVEDRHTTLS